MKKFFALVIALLLAACNSQKKYSDFDYSYTRSGGYAPIYENFLIKGNKAHYSLEGQGQNIKKDFKLTDAEIQKIEKTLSQNNFRTIREDYKKVYDNISTSIKVTNGSNSGSKTDASFILAGDQQKWKNVTSVFQELIKTHVTEEKAASR